MFAALCDNTEFFAKRMTKFVALAPVVRMSNMACEMVHKVAKDDVNGIYYLKKIGPEIFTKAAAGDPLTGMVSKNYFGSLVSDRLLRDSSDANTALISQKGLKNFAKFHPAGSSFGQFDHFH